MASRSAKKHAKGGKAHAQVYNAKGSKEEAEAEDEKPEFKKGGRKHPGHAEGGRAMAHGGRKPRSHKRAAGGRTPYSSGHETRGEKESGATNSGHEGQRPPLA